MLNRLRHQLLGAGELELHLQHRLAPSLLGATLLSPSHHVRLLLNEAVSEPHYPSIWKANMVYIRHIYVVYTSVEADHDGHPSSRPRQRVCRSAPMMLGLRSKRGHA